MPRANYKWCKDCKRHVTDAGPLSHNCLCADCSDRRRRSNAYALASHKGSGFQGWRRGHAAAVGGVLVDDLPPSWQRQLALLASGAIDALPDVVSTP